MDTILKSLDYDKKVLYEDLEKYGNPKHKPFIGSIITFAVFIALIITMIVFFILYRFWVALFILFIATLVFIVNQIFYTRELNNYKRVYARYIEAEVNKYARNNKLLPLSPYLSLFLHANDEKEALSIYHNDEVIFNAGFSEIRKYAIYYNYEYSVDGKLPQTPLKGILVYSFEIVLNDGKSFKVDIKNNYPKFVLDNKIGYLQFVNTKTINDLYTIVERAIKSGKKKNK